MMSELKEYWDSLSAAMPKGLEANKLDNWPLDFCSYSMRIAGYAIVSTMQKMDKKTSKIENGKFFSSNHLTCLCIPDQS